MVVDREMVGLGVDLSGCGKPDRSGVWVDVDRFHSLLQACKTHGHPEADVCSECLAALADGVELYRGDFLAGFTLRDSASFDEWQFFQTEGLRRGLASALERLVQVHTAQGECETAVAYARRWLRLDPLHEPAHRHLMRLYAQAGQRAAALRQYDECMRILENELGLAPSEETACLYEQIRTRAAEKDEPPAAIARPTVAERPQHNLPVQPTPFIGREDELAMIKARLDNPDCRLLTLVGPGGSGKTRLALEAADGQIDEFEHGVFFVSLVPLQSVDSIVPTVAQAVGFAFHGSGDPQQQ